MPQSPGRTGPVFVLGVENLTFDLLSLYSKWRTAIMVSIVSGTIEMVKLMLDHGAKIEATDIHGFTSLMAASGGGLTDIVKLFLDRGANINAKSNDGATGLKLAVSDEKTEVAALLRARGAQ